MVVIDLFGWCLSLFSDHRPIRLRLFQQPGSFLARASRLGFDLLFTKLDCLVVKLSEKGYEQRSERDFGWYKEAKWVEKYRFGGP
jgi:hypothetical protein